jgi:hypothetical protein
MRWEGHVAGLWNSRGAYGVFWGRSDRKGQLRRSRRRLEDNIKMDVQEVGWGGMGWIYLAQDMDKWCALVNAVMNIRVPYNEGDILTSWGCVGFSGNDFASCS